MNPNDGIKKFKSLFDIPVYPEGNLIILKQDSGNENQKQTNNAFSDKWTRYETEKWLGSFEKFQKNRYLHLYGFTDEVDLQRFLRTRDVILDAGCGPGYKSAWFARLSPDSMVVGMDFSQAISIASDLYKDIHNLFFVKGDIADTHLKDHTIDYINCDQVIHHTEDPAITFNHLCTKLSHKGELSCYVYAKKALPRELLDEHFRSYTRQCTREQLWEMSEQLTVLGKQLSELRISIEFPEIPLLGIKGGKQDLQRFIYWNFIKCFWNEELGWINSVAGNYDWYSPSNAFRYNEEEFRKWIYYNSLETIYFNKEEACFSGRFMSS